MHRLSPTARIIFIGMNPSGKGDWHKKATAISRFHEWIEYWGLPDWSFVNGSDKPGEFDHSTVDTNRLVVTIRKHDTVVALGTAMSKTLRRLGIEHFQMPHPSYRNRKLNDPAYERHMLDECARYIHEHAPTEHQEIHQGVLQTPERGPTEAQTEPRS